MAAVKKEDGLEVLEAVEQNAAQLERAYKNRSRIDGKRPGIELYREI
jgi:hypothetical protein